MPNLTVQLGAQAQTPDGRTVSVPPAIVLQQRGPVLQASISVLESMAKEILQQGKGVPAPKTGWAQIDTGASITCVDDGAAQELGLPPIDVVSLCSASHGGTQANVYPVQILIPELGMSLQAPRAVGAALAVQGLLVLIGRDVLQRCTLFYNGPMGQITLSI